jgi:hypothetical protein
MSLFAAVLERVPACSSPQGELLTAPFLDTCRLVLPVIGAQQPPLGAQQDGSLTQRDRQKAWAPPSAPPAWM